MPKPTPAEAFRLLGETVAAVSPGPRMPKGEREEPQTCPACEHDPHGAEVCMPKIFEDDTPCLCTGPQAP